MKTRLNKTSNHSVSRRRTQSRRRGGSVSRRRQLSRRRGGSYYPYNTKPMIFTNVSNKQQGGDARDTIFPSFITNMGRDAMYQVAQTYNSFAGNYSSVNPAPTEQKLLR